MRLPGFTAESSLGRSVFLYRSHGPAAINQAAIIISSSESVAGPFPVEAMVAGQRVVTCGRGNLPCCFCRTTDCSPTAINQCRNLCSTRCPAGFGCICS
jgi:hypothetical protein